MYLIQSNFGGNIGNFELVTLQGNQLIHAYHESANPQGPWKRGQVISNAATGGGAIIQSSFGSGPGNFEVVALEGNRLAHYYHDNSNPTGPWQQANVISTAATGPGAIIQSSFGSGTGNFEVVVPQGNQTDPLLPR